MSQGYTLDQIVNVVLEMEDIKKSRYESLRPNSWEKLGKSFRKIVGANKHDKPNTVQARTA
jgi:hypothetical protein